MVDCRDNFKSNKNLVFTEEPCAPAHATSFTTEMHTKSFCSQGNTHIHHLLTNYVLYQHNTPSHHNYGILPQWLQSLQSNHSKRLPLNYATKANPSNVIQTNTFKRLHIHSMTLKCTKVTQSNQNPPNVETMEHHANPIARLNMPWIHETKHSDIPLNKTCSKIVLTQQST